MTDENKLAINLEALTTKDTKLLFRDDEIDQILFSMNNGINTYIYGSVGIGKTTAVKHVIEKFNDAKHKAIYVNCSRFQTEYSILQAIIDGINSIFVQKIIISSRSNSDLLHRLEKDRERKYTDLKIIMLDDIQSLKETEVVDHLLEMGFKLILISDEVRAINRLSAQAQSHFAYTILFKDYTEEQVLKILNYKAKHLLGEGNYKQSLVINVAKLCNGNIGYAESLLLASTVRAVSLKKECVDESDIPAIEKPEEISHDEKIILDILKEEHSMQSGKLYLMYCERTRFPKSERTFRNYMQNLCKKNLVKAVGTNKGRFYELVK